MANAYWLDVSSDWSSGSNWSTGAVPTAADEVYILHGEKNIINVPGPSGGLNYQKFMIGHEFTGSLGTAANPCYVGNVVNTIIVHALQAQAVYLAIDSAKSAAIDVYSTSGRSADPLRLSGAGTWSSVNVHRAHLVRIATGPTVSLLVVGPQSRVVLESGATLTASVLAGGTVECLAAAGTIEIYTGTWDHIGDTTYDIATLKLGGHGSRFNFGSDGGTITSATMYHGSILDANHGVGKARTITTLTQYGGVLDRRGVGGTLSIGTHLLRGGDSLVGPPPGTR